MKTYFLSIVAGLISFASFPHETNAQKKQDCYTTYKSRGDAYNNAGNYDLAIQQYQSAKYCKGLTAVQKTTLDNLIYEVNRKKNRTRIITRRY